MSMSNNPYLDQTANSSEDHVIKGIDCHVTGCQYHHPGGKCSATNVKVEAPNAHSKTETYCGSFKSLDYSFGTGGTASASNCAPDACGDCSAAGSIPGSGYVTNSGFMNTSRADGGFSNGASDAALHSKASSSSPEDSFLS